MNKNNYLHVLMGKRKVGTLAMAPDHTILFEYDPAWLQSGFSISPLSLPLRSGVFAPKGYDPFEGLFGVFADSLPDGWGRLLVDRMLRKNKIDPSTLSALDRLAIVGSSGMGALTYQPEQVVSYEGGHLSLDELALQCRQLFDSNETDAIDELFQRGGSSGGARPKIFYQIDGEEWIVKFPASIDRDRIGSEEYAYSRCARRCGISMPETRLLPSKIYDGYFAVKRFDRKGISRIHMVSASALLETSHRIPNLDYQILMQLTLRLTHNYEELEKLFRLMCFNVFAHNRDDHSKNFSYLYTDETGWTLSPAYDLTYSNSIGGEHATTVNGNGRNPGLHDLMAVAAQAKLDLSKCRIIAEEIQEIVQEDLGKYL